MLSGVEQGAAACADDFDSTDGYELDKIDLRNEYFDFCDMKTKDFGV